MWSAFVSRRRGAVFLTAALLLQLFALAAAAPPAAAAGTVGPCGPPGSAALVEQVNFQPPTAPVPAGYTKQSGEAFSGTRGWVNAAGAPVSLEGQAKDRNLWNAAQYNDTLLVLAPVNGRFEYAVTNGRYEVSAAMGDAVLESGRFRLSVEGVEVIDHVPSSSAKMTTATACVDVTDGRITFDPMASSNGKIQWVTVSSMPSTDQRRIVEVDPTAGATDVPTSTSVTVTTSHSVNRDTVGPSSFQVLAPGDVLVAGNYNSDAAGGVASFTPSEFLAPNTRYTVRTTSELKDEGGTPFQPFTSTFTTGSGGVASANVNFDRIPIDSVTGPTVVTFGPDGKLYVGTTLGEIRRYTLAADGRSVGSPEVFTPFGAYSRIILGMAFAPGSTAQDLNLYVSHNVLGFGDQIPNFSGTVSLVTGTSTTALVRSRDVIVGLPRSAKDHMTNGVEFGPDNRLYIMQGSQSGYGAPDAPWGNRPEEPLSAAVLVADVLGSGFPSTVNVNTSTGYDYKAANAAVKVYADGLRNPYDLTWDAEGKLWSAVNEAARGDIPANTQPQNQGEIEGAQGGHDFLSQIKPDRYYGHPNPSYTTFAATGTRILNGGNPTSGPDPWEVPEYAVGIVPETRWDPPVVDLGLHRSPNGMDLYTPSTFNGEITNHLLIAEYSGGDDIIAVNPANGSVRQVAGGFFNPLDLRVDRSNGRIYVAEYGSDPEGGGGKVTLLAPNAASTSTPVARVNFQPADRPIPAGYVAQEGEAYTAAATHGWVTPGTTTPKSIVGAARDRDKFDERNQLQDTFIHVQGGLGTADFQHAVATGTYDVTVSVGDSGTPINSTHRIVVEGATAIAGFTPTATDKFRVATVRVSVTDGFLTVSANGGTNTKLNFVDINRIGTADTTPPVVDVTTAGPGGASPYSGPVTVSIAASDNVGVASLTYQLNGGPAQTYTGPFTVASTGTHTVVATATDGANNQGTDSETFVIQSAPPPAATTFTVETPIDRLGLSSRLVFSTMNHDVSEVETFTIRNTGTAALQVNSLNRTGGNAVDFVLASGQPSSFSVPAGGVATVGLQFTPKSTTYGNRFTSLEVATSAGTQTVRLRGVDHRRPPGSGGVEPTLQGLFDLFGFKVDAGFTGVNEATGPGPVGDEVLTPYFQRADSTQPVVMVPVARYVAATTATSASGSTAQNSNGQRREYAFAPDVVDDPNTPADETVFVQNQKTMPDTTGTTTLAVGDNIFGLHGNFANFSDDVFNVDTATGTTYHNLRIYPARNQDGFAIPHTYLVGVDIKTDPSKNFDYQDQVMVLLNARSISANPAPAPGDPRLDLQFASAPAGSVADKDGQGTGFTMVQANGTGTQYRPDLVDIDTAAGVLRLTSDAGKNSGATATQLNALQLAFDGASGTSVVEAELVSPGADLTAAFQQKAIYVGPDQDNYVKLEIERRNDPNGTYLTLFREVARSTATVAKVTVPNPGSVTSLVLRLSATASTGVVTASASTNGGPFQTVGSYTIAAASRARFFNNHSKAGILVSHTAPSGVTNGPVVGTYDWFRITRP